MPACPICATPSGRQRADTPYWICDACGLWFQSPLPPKRWHGPHEVWLGQPMPDAEKAANEALAKWLFDEVMHKRAGLTFDVGASYPYLAHCLAQHGCNTYAIDGSDEITAPHGLNVKCWQSDIETCGTLAAHAFDLITFVHNFEHLYDPVAIFRKLRPMLVDDGRLFIRMPDNGVPGIERDVTPGHFQIHPYVHALSSIAQLCAQTDTFTIECAIELRPGQRDIVMRPI